MPNCFSLISYSGKRKTTWHERVWLAKLEKISWHFLAWICFTQIWGKSYSSLPTCIYAWLLRKSSGSPYLTESLHWLFSERLFKRLPSPGELGEKKEKILFGRRKKSGFFPNIFSNVLPKLSSRWKLSHDTKLVQKTNELKDPPDMTWIQILRDELGSVGISHKLRS